LNRETLKALTEAIACSGKVLRWPQSFRTGDVPSTGGVGNKTPIAAAAMLAALGFKVPKMSGRALRHTGGSIDILESIPGFRAEWSADAFQSLVGELGFAITAQTAELAPADRKLYALRKQTRTVDSIPLIASSIISKKLAMGVNIVVVDVKAGRGAIIQDYDQALELARELVWVGTALGIQTAAVITENDSPQGRYVGNLLAVAEIVQVLKGIGPRDVTEASIELAALALILGSPSKSLERAREEATNVLLNGRAFDAFRSMIERLGGDISYVDKPNLCYRAPIKIEVTAPRSGVIRAIDAEKVNEALRPLVFARSGRRETLQERRSGVRIDRKPGDRVVKGQRVMTLFCGDIGSAEATRRMLRRAIETDEDAEHRPQTVLARILPDGCVEVPREIDAAVVIVKDVTRRGSTYLVQLNRRWGMFNFISGKRESGEDLCMRGTAMREVEEELELVRDEDFTVEEIATNPVEVIQYSRRESCYTRYQFYLYHLTFFGERRSLLQRLSRNVDNRWLTEAELTAGWSGDGSAVSPSVVRIVARGDLSLRALPTSFSV
jgi:pyrimidine-nucleoside phosphorylase